MLRVSIQRDNGCAQECTGDEEFTDAFKHFDKVLLWLFDSRAAQELAGVVLFSHRGFHKGKSLNMFFPIYLVMPETWIVERC